METDNFIFWFSLFQEYRQVEEVKRFLDSVVLSYRKIRRAKQLTLTTMRVCLENTEQTQTGCSLQILKYYSGFVNNIYACIKRQHSLQHGLRVSLPRKLFHGTTTMFLEGIRKEGLQPSRRGKVWTEDKDKLLKKVCFTDSLLAAEYFAYFAAEQCGGEPVVLKINIKGLEDKMIKKPENLNRDGLFTVFECCNEFYFTEPVPSNRIKGWYVLPDCSAYLIFTLLSCEFSKEAKNQVADLQSQSVIVK